MRKFVRKSDAVEAMHFDGSKESAAAILGWVNSKGSGAWQDTDSANKARLIVWSQNDMAFIYPGAWIVHTADGTFRGYNEDEFEDEFDVVGVEAPLSGMLLANEAAGVRGEVDGVSVTADGRALARINDHWFFADDLT